MPTAPLAPCRLCRKAGGDCPDHRRLLTPSRQERGYDAAWTARSRAVVAAHVAANGWVCPGAESHPSHPSRDLTCDHVLELANGGSSDGEIRILCRAWNSHLGGQLAHRRRRGRISRGTVTTRTASSEFFA